MFIGDYFEKLVTGINFFYKEFEKSGRYGSEPFLGSKPYPSPYALFLCKLQYNLNLVTTIACLNNTSSVLSWRVCKGAGQLFVLEFLQRPAKGGQADRFPSGSTPQRPLKPFSILVLDSSGEQMAYLQV